MTATITSTFSRIAVFASLTFVGAGGMLVASSDPAEALCKGIGAGRCIERKPFDKWEVKVPETRLPDSGWIDSDCKYYGNCLSPNSARKASDAKSTPSGTVGKTRR